MKTTLTACGATLLACLLLLPAATAAPAQSITVAFTADDKGFSVTSDKDISNVIVQYCDGTTLKYDDLTGHNFTANGSLVILGVWVKSGNNFAIGPAPSGAGERFDNLGVQCTTTTTTTPATTTSGTGTTSATETTTSNTTATTKIPFFPSLAALALGGGGAAVAMLVMLRRRL